MGEYSYTPTGVAVSRREPAKATESDANKRVTSVVGSHPQQLYPTSIYPLGTAANHSLHSFSWGLRELAKSATLIRHSCLCILPMLRCPEHKRGADARSTFAHIVGYCLRLAGLASNYDVVYVMTGGGPYHWEQPAVLYLVGQRQFQSGLVAGALEG